jgi:anti-sigma-K factor RskA
MSLSTSTEADRDPQDLADHYVLGLLDDAERRALEADLAHDGALAVAVARARDRFLALDLTAPEGSPSEALWPRIEALIGTEASVTPTSTASARPAAAAPAASKMAANDNAVFRWRLAAFAGMAASLLLAAGLAFNLTAQPEPQLIAVLVDEAGEPLVLVEDFGNDSGRITPLTDLEVPADSTLQVWTLPNAEMGPMSLGLLENSQSSDLEWDDLPDPQPDQLYEITIEQEGGSPTNRPTGPIVGKGFAKEPR